MYAPRNCSIPCLHSMHSNVLPIGAGQRLASSQCNMPQPAAPWAPLSRACPSHPLTPTQPISPCPAGTVLAAFQPAIPLAALAGWFGFTHKKEASAFLREKGAVVVDGCLDIKQSRAAAQRLAAAAALEEQAAAAQMLPRR